MLPDVISGWAASLHLLGRNEEALEATLRFPAVQELVGARLPWFDG